jgi:hypothetical protein
MSYSRWSQCSHYPHGLVLNRTEVWWAIFNFPEGGSFTKNRGLVHHWTEVCTGPMSSEPFLIFLRVAPSLKIEVRCTTRSAGVPGHHNSSTWLSSKLVQCTPNNWYCLFLRFFFSKIFSLIWREIPWLRQTLLVSIQLCLNHLLNFILFSNLISCMTALNICKYTLHKHVSQYSCIGH